MTELVTNAGPKTTDRDELIRFIWQLNEDELRFLNAVIVDRLKLVSQARSTVMLAKFSVGDRVKFESSSGQVLSGIIQRLNKKTASILTDEGQRWNVHPGFLRHLNRAEA